MIEGPGAAARGILFAVALLAPACAAAQIGREVPLAALHGFVGRMTVSPEHDPAGTRVCVVAEEVPADTDFQLVWRTVKGSWKVAGAEYHGREYQPVAYEIATVRTDAAGKVAAVFTVPEDFGFVHDIVLQRAERLFIQAGFTVDMTVRLLPENGPVGTPITVEVAPAREQLAAALRQQFYGLDIGGDHDGLGDVHHSGQWTARCAHARTTARRVHLPLPQYAAESRIRPAAFRAAFYRYPWCAGIAATDRGAGAAKRAPAARIRCARGRAALRRGRPASGGKRGRLHPGQALCADVDDHYRQSHGRP